MSGRNLLAHVISSSEGWFRGLGLLALAVGHKHSARSADGGEGSNKALGDRVVRPGMLLQQVIFLLMENGVLHSWHVRTICRRLMSLVPEVGLQRFYFFFSLLSQPCWYVVLCCVL